MPSLLTRTPGRVRLALSALLLCAVALASAPLTGCSKEETPSAGGGKIRIGVSLLTQQHDFYQDLQAGLEAAAKRHDFSLSIQSGENDAAEQAKQLQTFITQKVDAIVVCPCDSAGISQSIQRANEAGIPVFTADIAANGGEVVCHVASDNAQGGRLAAETLIRFMGDAGEVIVIDHPEVESVQQRVRGFEEVIAKHPNITIVDKPSSTGQRNVAFQVMQAKLKSNPNLKGVFGINDESALGALRAVEQTERDIVIVGYDATAEAREKIKAGTALKADVVQSPKTIGETTIEAIAQHLSGTAPPKVIPVEVGVVDQESLK